MCSFLLTEDGEEILQEDGSEILLDLEPVDTSEINLDCYRFKILNRGGFEVVAMISPDGNEYVMSSREI